jgi:small-conductance mechanosensitive channel
MAETLIVNGAEAPTEGLSSEEQESYEIGEELQQQQEGLLAGKYADAAQLEQAYLELQQKLGEREEAAEEQDQKYVESEDEPEEVTEAVGLSQEDVNALQELVGGKQQYNAMTRWAADNLSQDQIELFDSVIDGGDPAACFFAVQTLMNQYSEAFGDDGELLTGNEPANTSNTFRSQAELVATMSDPRYDNDPAYRDDVLNKLANSDLEF